jgi:hypothetical protein
MDMPLSMEMIPTITRMAADSLVFVITVSPLVEVNYGVQGSREREASCSLERM